MVVGKERKLQIEELDEWQTQKSRTPDKLKPSQDKLNTSPNKLKVGDKVLLVAAGPRIATPEPNEEIPLTVLNIFPYGTVEVIHPKFGTFKEWTYVHERGPMYTDMGEANEARHDRTTRLCEPTHPKNTGVGQMPDAPKFKIRETHGQKLGHTGVSHGRTMSSSRGKKTAVLASKKRKGAASFSVSPRWSSSQLRVPDFGIALGLYTEEFIDDNELNTLHRHIHYSPSKCWRDLVPASGTYDPSSSKASALLPSLWYLHAILPHTLIARRESTGIVTTHNAYFLWSMVNGHVIDLAYFIPLAICHQTERHRRGVISIGPYVTRLAWHFGLLNTEAQSSSPTLNDQMPLQGISSMLSMRMIEK
ncbi:hypothetical protein GOBAR_AA16293 [Gossypium barbadense]|uniref:Uncharacterized protein n=1 Tax=Gossypium barbadense TaxID=3634 RepID=A0A2P5XLZ9_GOSBA|nr:hypothetical protein GOBAR_AA16293 [Gossypium barbadense]